MMYTVIYIKRLLSILKPFIKEERREADKEILILQDVQEHKSCFNDFLKIFLQK